MALVNNLNFGLPCGVGKENPDPSDFRWTMQYASDLSAHFLFWRVKKLRMAINATVRAIIVEGGEEVSDTTDSGSGEVFLGYPEEYTEKNLVCDINPNGGLFEYVETPSINIAGGWDEFFDRGFTIQWRDSDNSTVYFDPSTYFVGFDSPTVGIGAFVGFNYGYSTDGIPNWNDSEYIVNLGQGYSYRTLVSLPQETQIIGESTFIRTINSFSLDVGEYWGYDPEDGGGPIYNSSTGQRIRFDI